MADVARTALVLSGGGARGAYEMGVARYVCERVSTDVPGGVHFDVLCGNSVGAINTTFLAAVADEGPDRARKGAALWESLRIEDTLRLGWLELLRFPGWLLGGKPPAQRGDSVAMFDSAPLVEVVRSRTSWRSMHRNIKRGLVYAVSVAATSVTTGITMVFVQRSDGKLPSWSRDPSVRAVATTIGPRHVLASAAIPLVFPPVEISGDLYIDGSLRQSTPLSPALRLGASRVLVVSMARPQRGNDPGAIGRLAHAAKVSPTFILGKALAALMQDRLEYDLDRMHRFNHVVEHASTGDRCDHCGTPMSHLFADARGTEYRLVRDVVVRPTENLAAVAWSVVKSGRLERRMKGPLGWLLKRAIESREAGESDLLSFLLFDGAYAHELIRLGYEDAQKVHDKLVDLFASPTTEAETLGRTLPPPPPRPETGTG